MSAQSAFTPPGSGALAACEQTWKKRNRWIVKLPLQNPEEVFWSLRIKITEKLFCCNSGLVRCCCEKQLWPFCWSLHHDHLETEARSLKWTHFPVSPKIIMLVAEWWHLRSCDHARAARGQEHILVTKWYFWSSWSQDQFSCTPLGMFSARAPSSVCAVAMFPDRAFQFSIDHKIIYRLKLWTSTPLAFCHYLVWSFSCLVLDQLFDITFNKLTSTEVRKLSSKATTSLRKH